MKEKKMSKKSDMSSDMNMPSVLDLLSGHGNDRVIEQEKEKLHKQVEAWVLEHYPDYQNPLAYWDE